MTHCSFFASAPVTSQVQAEFRECKGFPDSFAYLEARARKRLGLDIDLINLGPSLDNRGKPAQTKGQACITQLRAWPSPLTGLPAL